MLADESGSTSRSTRLSSVLSNVLQNAGQLAAQLELRAQQLLTLVEVARSQCGHAKAVHGALDSRARRQLHALDGSSR